MTNLTPNFTLEQLIFSDYAKIHKLDNQPPEDQEKIIHENLTYLSEHVLEPLLDLIGPFHILSGYRNPALNTAVKGSKTSQHMEGLACDLVPSRMTLEQAIEMIKVSDIPTDQCILEFGSWIHISSTPHRKNRKQFLEFKKQ